MAERATERLVRDDRVLPATRALSVFIIPFLVLAFVVLFFWPSDTGRLFAWPITPPLTAMILGSVYLGGAYFFVRAARATRWHTVKGGFPPVATFATLMGIATALHWGKFTHSHVAFWLWVALYFTTPFLVAGVWVVNRRFEDRAPDDRDVAVPPVMGRVIGAIGVLAACTSAVLFLLPARAIALWPWTLTPLTARVMGAIFALGIAAIGAFRESRWSAVRILLQVEMFMLVLILVSAVRGAGDLDPSNVLTWLFAAGFVGVLGASAVFYVRMEQRRP
ncbi:MAG: hypothetical protein ACXVXT_10390 [Blastococcus sp.]